MGDEDRQGTPESREAGISHPSGWGPLLLPQHITSTHFVCTCLWEQCQSLDTRPGHMFLEEERGRRATRLSPLQGERSAHRS